MYIVGETNNPDTIISPFWATSGRVSFKTINLLEFQKSTTSDKKDFHPRDSWELLIKDFGSSASGNSGVTYPFFALYNRFTGKFPAFFN
jgi:hypothetical protein